MLLLQQGVDTYKVPLIPQDPYQPQVFISPEPVRSTIPKGFHLNYLYKHHKEP